MLVSSIDNPISLDHGAVQCGPVPGPQSEVGNEEHRGHDGGDDFDGQDGRSVWEHLEEALLLHPGLELVEELPRLSSSARN